MEDRLRALQQELDALKLKHEKERLRRLSNYKTFLAISTALLGLLGFTALVQVPRAATQALADAGAGSALDGIRELHREASEQHLPAIRLASREAAEARERSEEIAQATEHSIRAHYAEQAERFNGLSGLVAVTGNVMTIAGTLVAKSIVAEKRLENQGERTFFTGNNSLGEHHLVGPMPARTPIEIGHRHVSIGHGFNKADLWVSGKTK